MLRGLVIGIQDIRYPIHGSARLALVTMHALALSGHKIDYLALWSYNKSEAILVTTRSRWGFARINMIKVPIKINSNSLPILSSSITDPIIKLFHEDYDYILCLERRYIPTVCRYFSKKLSAPLIAYMDSPKYMHPERLTTTELLVRPAALAWYVITSHMSDLTICVSKYIEVFLKKWGTNAITIEPTYALLGRDSDILSKTNNGNYDINSINHEAVLCSCPLNLTVITAIKNPDVPIVVTGPQAYYVREYLKMRGLLNKVKNIHLLHNISDEDLEKLHNKIVAALVARPALSGLSITLLQELYFGRPVLTDENTASKIRGLIESGSVLINNKYSEWPTTLKSLLNNDEQLRELSRRAESFFNRILSPVRFAETFNHALRSLNLR